MVLSTAIVCDRLRSRSQDRRRSQKCVSIWSQMIAELFAICDPRSSAIIWKPALRGSLQNFGLKKIPHTKSLKHSLRNIKVSFFATVSSLPDSGWQSSILLKQQSRTELGSPVLLTAKFSNKICIKWSQWVNMFDPKALAMSPTNPTAATHTYSAKSQNNKKWNTLTTQRLHAMWNSTQHLNKPLQIMVIFPKISWTTQRNHTYVLYVSSLENYSVCGLKGYGFWAV